MGGCASSDETEEDLARISHAAYRERVEGSELLQLVWSCYNCEGRVLEVHSLETVEALAELVAVALSLREGDGKFLRVECNEEEVHDRGQTLQDIGMHQQAR